MGKKEFTEELVGLLARIERGMLEFDEPLPVDVVKGVMTAIVGLGEYAVPILHKSRLDNLNTDMAIGGHRFIEILGQIGHPSSVPIIIEIHKHSSYDGALAAIQALAKLKTDEGYEYLCYILDQYAAGNPRVIESRQELVTSCRALGEWQDNRAIETLKKSISIQFMDKMPQAAIRALVQYPDAHEYLRELAEQNTSLKEMITKAFSDMPND